MRYLNTECFFIHSQTDNEDETNEVKISESVLVLLIYFKPLLISTFPILIHHVVKDNKGLGFGEQLRYNFEVFSEIAESFKYFSRLLHYFDGIDIEVVLVNPIQRGGK